MAGDDDNECDGPDYPVGYKKPPRHTQFKPGQSGNPKGRPKKSATLNDIILENLGKKVTIMDSTKVRNVSILEAIVLMLINKATKGDYRSMQMVFDLLQSASHRGDSLAELLRQFRAINARHEVRCPLPSSSTRADHSKDDEAQ